MMRDENDIHLWIKPVATSVRYAGDDVYTTADEPDDDVTSKLDVLQVDEDVSHVLVAGWLPFEDVSLSG